jgi:hypothetical protein
MRSRIALSLAWLPGRTHAFRDHARRRDGLDIEVRLPAERESGAGSARAEARAARDGPEADPGLDAAG